MARGKMVYISEDAHRQLRLLAARRSRPMGEVVAALIEHELADLTNPWTGARGLDAATAGAGQSVERSGAGRVRR